MEFDYIGKHCSLSTCNQKDFLPFKCDHCQRDFCLEHRSYTCHGCEGGLSKDVTSTDCPMCGKSIRFTKAQDPNIIWEEHYLHGCTQQTQAKTAKKCAKSDCRTTIGPSNSFTCSKCRQTVCISHRLSEDHNCAAVLRQTRADALQSKITRNPSASKAVSKTVSSSGTTIGAKKAAEKQDENSLRGSAARRAQSSKLTLNEPTVPSSSSSKQGSSVNNPFIIDEHICPFLCGKSFSNSSELSNHINSTHNETVSRPPAASAEQAGNEICPICSKRFSDTVALVTHFEQSHNESSNTSSASSRTTVAATTAASGGNQCNLN